MNLLDWGSKDNSLCVHFSFEHFIGVVIVRPFSSITSVLCPIGHMKTSSFARGFTSDARKTIPDTLVILPMISALI